MRKTRWQFSLGGLMLLMLLAALLVRWTSNSESGERVTVAKHFVLSKAQMLMLKDEQATEWQLGPIVYGSGNLCYISEHISSLNSDAVCTTTYVIQLPQELAIGAPIELRSLSREKNEYHKLQTGEIYASLFAHPMTSVTLATDTGVVGKLEVKSADATGIDVEIDAQLPMVGWGNETLIIKRALRLEKAEVRNPLDMLPERKIISN